MFLTQEEKHHKDDMFIKLKKNKNLSIASYSKGKLDFFTLIASQQRPQRLQFEVIFNIYMF